MTNTTFSGSPVTFTCNGKIIAKGTINLKKDKLMSNNNISSRFDGFTNATMSAREFTRQITQIQSNKEKPMYKVKTDQFKFLEEGEKIYESDKCNHDGQWVEFAKLIECFPNWFEEVERAQKGQYWEWESSVYRVMRSRGNDWVCKDIRTELTRTPNTRWLENNARKLSDDQIQKALTEEAKRRFGKIEDSDAFYKPWYGHKTIITLPGSSGWVYEADSDILRYCGFELYKQGEWAEKVDQTPDIEINGIKFCGVEGCELVFSCGEYIDIDDYKIFYRFVRFHDLKIHRKGEDITDQIKQIAEYYE